MVKIVIDSTAGMEKETAAELGITVIPLKVLFSDGEYYEGFPDSYPFFMKKYKSRANFQRPACPRPRLLKRHLQNLQRTATRLFA